MMMFSMMETTSNRTRRPAVYVLVLFVYICYMLGNEYFSFRIINSMRVCVSLCVCIRKCFSINVCMEVCSICIGAKSMHT